MIAGRNLFHFIILFKNKLIIIIWGFQDTTLHSGEIVRRSKSSMADSKPFPCQGCPTRCGSEAALKRYSLPISLTYNDQDIGARSMNLFPNEGGRVHGLNTGVQSQMPPVLNVGH